jgi:hypothetical protein
MKEREKGKAEIEFNRKLEENFKAKAKQTTLTGFFQPKRTL